MLFECFGSPSPKAFEAGSFFVCSVGNVSGVFRAAVSHGLGTNPAAVRVFRKRSFSTCATFWHFFCFPMQGHLPRWCRSDEWSGYIGQRDLFFMDSKGDVKQFFDMRFAWHGLESCCCSSVSEPASKGLALSLRLQYVLFSYYSLFRQYCLKVYIA